MSLIFSNYLHVTLSSLLVRDLSLFPPVCVQKCKVVKGLLTFYSDCLFLFLILFRHFCSIILSRFVIPVLFSVAVFISSDSHFSRKIVSLLP